MRDDTAAAEAVHMFTIGAVASAPKRNLLISRVGRRSLHQAWLQNSEERTFDILLSAYDERLPDQGGSGVIFEYRPGKKVEGYAQILSSRKEVLDRYEYVAMFDEDLLCDSLTIDKMFEICHSYGLSMAQPSLTRDSHFTYGGTISQPDMLLRYVNFVEMMAPVFRRDILDEIAPLFHLGFESGIDLVWCNLVHRADRKFAVIDACQVKHTEPVGGRKTENGFAGRNYEDDIYAVLELFRLPWLSMTPYAGITRAGSTVTSRARLLFRSLSNFRAVFANKGALSRARKFLVHWRHIATRPARNIAISWPTKLSAQPHAEAGRGDTF